MTDRPHGIFRRDWLPSWETYAAQAGIALAGRGAQRRTQCPLHGGTRDSLTINTGEGPWECKACGASGGDVLDFHRQLHGGSFVEAAQALGAWEADDGSRPPAQPMPEGAAAPAHQPEPAPPQHETLSDFGLELWRACKPLGGAALAYLQARCCVIPPADGDLRWHPALKHPPSGAVGPALVALVTDAVTCQPLTLHRTWIRFDGTKAPFEPPRMLLGGHRKAGGVVRLWPDEAVTLGLGIAEGIETALSLAHGFTPAWAAIDAGNLAALPVLAGVESLMIAADHDAAGRRAADACARRWADAGREVAVVLPPEAETDVNDMARAA